MLTFAESKARFDGGPGKNQILPRSLVTVDGRYRDHISIRNAKGDPLEEYYKWQFIHALIHSGLYAKDYIG
jgi:type I restriction enzyme M protein